MVVSFTCRIAVCFFSFISTRSPPNTSRLPYVFAVLTFGANSGGIVLNNYAAKDVGAIVSRVLVLASVIGAFPILFGACRSAAIDMFGRGCREKQRQKVSTALQEHDFHRDEEEARRLLQARLTKATKKKYTAILLSLLTATSMCVKDAGFVVAFNGAVMGSAIIYIFPALMFLRQQKRQRQEAQIAQTPFSDLVATYTSSRTARLERWICRFLVAFGVAAAGVGGVTSILNAYFPSMLT